MRWQGEKYLHALKLAPMDTMSAADLETAPPACTRDPFASISAGLLPTAAAGVKRPPPGVDGAAAPASKRQAAADGDVQADRVFMGNVSYQATEEQIREFFSSVGTVTSVSIAKSQEDGRCVTTLSRRGFLVAEAKRRGLGLADRAALCTFRSRLQRRCATKHFCVKAGLVQSF